MKIRNNVAKSEDNKGLRGNNFEMGSAMKEVGKVLNDSFSRAPKEVKVKGGIEGARAFFLSEEQARELKELRKAHKVMQREVADAVGISRAGLSRIEGRKRKVTQQEYEEIKDFIQNHIHAVPYDVNEVELKSTERGKAKKAEQAVTIDEVLALVDELNTIDERIGRHKIKAIEQDVKDLITDREKVEGELNQLKITRKGDEE